MKCIYNATALTIALFSSNSAFACNICGTENQVITLPTNEITIVGAGQDETPVLESCIAYQTTVTSNNVTDEECAMIQATLGDCGCAPAGSSVVRATFAPTVSPAPTRTAQPTNPEPACLICGQEGLRVDPEATLLLFGVNASCGELEFENTRNYDLAPAEICEIVQVEVMAHCGCTADTAEETDESPAPFSTCNICGTENQVITLPTNEINIAGALQDETPVLESCIAYQTTVTSSNVTVEECATIQATLGDCGCAPEGSSVARTTFAPTVSPAPTRTAQPTNPEPACLICGQEGLRVDPEATLLLFGVNASCGELEFENTRNYDLAPAEICEIVQVEVMAHCGCTADTAEETGGSPTLSPVDMDSSEARATTVVAVCSMILAVVTIMVTY